MIKRKEELRGIEGELLKNNERRSKSMNIETIAPHDTDDKYSDTTNIIEPRKGSNLYKKIKSVYGE
ncbi:hypothetical protein [Staphylococcus debuckii]|uniref:hypothetical protein n=1 Tax=Staphylococcus debuckii TaxID=2044912 RepID=UPI000F438996|nr:hypothetical protein [Staphylococcus debuckii]AYU54950.1 hypothetical protein CNQ82_05690 [Staphylococcus debuckii]